MKNLSVENRFAAVVALLKWNQLRVEFEIKMIDDEVVNVLERNNKAALAKYRQWPAEKRRAFAIRQVVNRFNHQ